MELIRTRECDGACCKSSPQFPDKAGVCGYQDSDGCRLMKDRSLRDNLTLEGLAKFLRACKEWPHNMPGRDTGKDCCWQWVDNG